jgi:hypothetical protein
MTIETNQTIQEPKPSFSLWNQLETKQITKEQLPITLFKKLGEPTNELQANLAQEILKKIISYYFSAEADQNYTIYSVVGYVAEIVQRKWKEGPKKGQVYYDLILKDTKEKLKAQQELLKPEQWTQIVKLALLGQNLVFQYRKWFSNKQILGWYLATRSKN